MIDIKGAAHPMVDSEARIIVGLSGYARAGKDETAKVLIEEFGFKRFSFADKLRTSLYELNPIVQANEGSPTYIRLQTAVDNYGWDGVKSSPFSNEIRALMQRMGTEVGRNTINDDIWVQFLDEQQGRTVVTDMRFQNEYDQVVKNGGITVRVTRPGVVPINNHPSEVALDHVVFDAVINNDGGLNRLKYKVRNLAARYSL